MKSASRRHRIEARATAFTERRVAVVAGAARGAELAGVLDAAMLRRHGPHRRWRDRFDRCGGLSRAPPCPRHQPCTQFPSDELAVSRATFVSLLDEHHRAAAKPRGHLVEVAWGHLPHGAIE